MMFRYGKIIESNNKSTRSDRFAEMSKQQQLIESKKQEIKARFEERKRQEVVDTLNKPESTSIREPTPTKDMKPLSSNRIQSWKRLSSDMHSVTSNHRWKKKQRDDDSNPSSSISNVFSNDGSFLEKYKQIAETKTTEDQSGHDMNYYDDQRPENRHREEEHYAVSQHSDGSIMAHTANEGIPYPPPNMSVLPVSSSLSMNAQQQSLYSITAHPPPAVQTVPSNIHTSIATVPASVPVLSAVASSGTSLQTVSLIQVPVSVPASSVILSCPLETTLVSSQSVVHLPVVHSTLSHSSISVPIQTVPLQTAVIPTQIQITSQDGVSQSTVQTVQINQSPTNVIIQPQSILVSSECIQQQAPPTTLPNTNVPPPPILNTARPQPSISHLFSSSTLTSGVFNMSSAASPDTSTLPPVHIPPPNYNPMASRESLGLDPINNVKFAACNRSLTTSESDTRQMIQSSNHNVGRDDVGYYDGAMNRSVADCGRSMDNQSLFRERSGCENMKYVPDDRNMLNSRYRSSSNRFRMEKANESRACNENNSRCQSTNSLRSARDEDSADVDEKRQRRCKRRSRWAPEESKVDMTSLPGVPSTPRLGTVPLVPVTRPTSTTKLPGLSGPMLSHVKQNDPALIQYALKAFGTVNLSDEDWKKAEDHYKINLLYQDMVKKRQEIERLSAAGKFKYEYDSDEETEGGTWEHKLRTQEMIATQRWADELTEQSKGKHHIGDFLPPDELERFMEKYDALKEGREPDLSDYKEFKLKEDNIGFQMLQKLGWTEGQGLGSDGSGIVNPVGKAPGFSMSHGLGIERPDEVHRNDDEYDAYRKRMMLAYRFRPNPLNNPRRPYY